jgi:hypothetical protein
VIKCDEFFSIPFERVEELIKLIRYIEHADSNEKQVGIDHYYTLIWWIEN